MVTDALLAPLLALVAKVVGWLPDGNALPLPSLTPLLTVIGQVDSLVPIAGPLAVVCTILAAGAVFVLVRLVLTVWNLIWP
jgi:hypothetical protein